MRHVVTAMRHVLVLFALLAAACGGADVIDPPASTDPVPLCDDVPRINASDSDYGDSPIYVGNEMPVEQVRAWAGAHPGFETLWIDREHNGWITVAFSQDADARRAELVDEFPDAGVVVVEVEWTMTELQELQASLPDRFEPGFLQHSGIYDDRGVVGVGIGALSPERIAVASEELAGERVCLEGFDPALLPEPGPQPQAGDGWRLLGDEKTGFAYRTGFASDQRDLEALWREAGLTAPLPAVDFETEVVIWFGAVYGSSCPNLRLDDVVVEDGVVYPLIVDVDGPQGCTADANPHAYVVAVERSELPADGFVIRLQADEPSSGVLDQQTFVRGDATIPGSYVAGVRGELPGEEPGPPHVEYGGVIEPGYPWSYNLYVHCGIEWLGEINGIQWRAESVPDGDYLPDEWQQVVDENEYVTVELLLTPGDPPVLEATALGHTVRYLPAAEDPPGCD